MAWAAQLRYACLTRRPQINSRESPSQSLGKDVPKLMRIVSSSRSHLARRGLHRFATILLFAMLAISLPTTGDRAADQNNAAIPERLDVAGLQNVFRISDRLFSGGSPADKTSFNALRKLGIQTVLSVDGAKPDTELAHSFGLRYVHIPIGYNGISREQSLQIAKAMRDAPRPIYIHCHHGQHRGPAAAAIARLCADESCAVDDALAVMRIAGTDPKYSGLFQSVRNFRPQTAAELDALPVELPEVAAVADLTQAMVAIDRTFENLKAARGVQWRAPPDHPELEPAHEALQLVEHYQELLRLADAKTRSPEFQTLAKTGLAKAKELKQALHSLPGQSKLDEPPAEKLFQQSAAVCRQCHAKLRDAP